MVGDEVLSLHGGKHRSGAAFWADETDLDLTMLFLDAASGRSELDDVLEHLARSLGAEVALISQGDVRRETSRTLSRSGRRWPPAGRDGLARDILGPLYFHMRPGAACLASEHLVAAGPGGPALRDLLGEQGLVDVGLIVLECTSDVAHYLELHFSSQIEDDTGRRLEGLARAFSRVWQLVGAKLDFTPRAVPDVAKGRQGIPASPWLLDERNPGRLTKAEFRICLLLSRGLSANAVARELDVSVTTIRTHLRSIYRKAEVSGFGELSHRLTSRHDRISATLSARMTA